MPEREPDFPFTTGAVLQLVRESPGLRFEDLLHRSGSRHAVVRAHLDQLLAARRVRFIQVGGEPLLYPRSPAADLGEDATSLYDARCVLADERGRRVAWAIVDMPRAPLDDVAERAGVRPSWAAACIHHLARAGLVHLQGEPVVAVPSRHLAAPLRTRTPPERHG